MGRVRTLLDGVNTCPLCAVDDSPAERREIVHGARHYTRPVHCGRRPPYSLLRRRGKTLLRASR